MKVIIIGAGISGLTAGVYSRRSGLETLILEKCIGPGGLSTSWKRKGYTFEGGIHWLIGAIESNPLYRIWKETGALQENNPVFFKDPIYTLVDGEDRIPLYRALSEVMPERACSMPPFATSAGFISRGSARFIPAACPLRPKPDASPHRPCARISI